MTVESTLRKVTYEGNGVATSFPVPFTFSQATDLSLVFTNAAGVDSAVTSNFEVVTVSGGTSVTYPVSGSPMATGTRLTIFRETPQTQIVALEQGGAFAPDVLEHDGFDRIVMMVQEVQEGLDRAVKVSISSDTTPGELIDDLFDAADSAAESAAQALASADNARESAQNARASEVLAAESRDWACECAERAEDARDVAIQQTEATNVLMATELAKINTIVDANRDNQELTVERARKWAENEHNVPVDVDDDGRPMYSARHWATEAEEINIPIMSKLVRGTARVGEGLTISGEDKLSVAVGEGLTISGGKINPFILCEFYSFRHPTLRPGFYPRTGGLLENAATLHPEAWAYLQTTEGQLLCKTEAEWQAMSVYVWHTNADGTKVGFNGIGGVPFYAPNLATGALRLPDTRGMSDEDAGFDGLGVGGVQGDGTPRLYGVISGEAVFYANPNDPAGLSTGVFRVGNASGYRVNATSAPNYSYGLTIDSARTVATANKVQPRAWISLACVYLGQPAS